MGAADGRRDGRLTSCGCYGSWVSRFLGPAYGQSAAETRVRSEKGGIATGSLPAARAAIE